MSRPPSTRPSLSAPRRLVNCRRQLHQHSRRFALAAEAAKHRLPAIYTDVEYVMAGGLMALGPGHAEGYYGAAKHVDMILHGANPADLPDQGS